MKVELKDLDKPFNRLRLTKFDDGLIRGGAVGALNASVVDTLRIGKFLTDLPKGPLFLIKQVGLQLSNPRLEAKKGISGFLSSVGSTRLYNLGINTIAQVPLNAFGGHLVRHGLLPVMNDDTKYLSVATDNNKLDADNSDSKNNRLVSLRNKFNLGGGYSGENVGGLTNQISNYISYEGKRSTFPGINAADLPTYAGLNLFKTNQLGPTKLIIDEYTGGPNSVYGIGRTTIKRRTLTEDSTKIKESFSAAKTTTINRSLTVNPLQARSNYTDTLGNFAGGNFQKLKSSFIWGNLQNPTDEDQFKALGKRKSLSEYDYLPSGSEIPVSKIQKAIGNGNIEVYPHSNPDSGSSFENRHWEAFHGPAINPIISTPSDKFKVIKSQEEDTDYIKSKRIVTFEDDTKGTFTVIQNGDAPTGTQTFTGKTKAEAEAKLSDWNTVSHNLNEVVVTNGKPKITNTVKAHIVDVKGFEGDLEDAYKSGLMVDSPKTEIYQNNFVTDEVSIDRDPKYKNTNKPSFKYFNGTKKVSNFERIDQDIMIVNFTTIDPFTAADSRNVHFSAYLSGFKYNSNSTWNPIKYVGRAESFYTFTEHKRDVSFNLQIPCFNKVHLFEKHRALSEMQSAGAGTYGTGNRLAGVITKVTLGNYLVEEPGILTSISFDIPDTSSWDIDEKLAMYINAQFNFTIIGKELPTYQEGGFLHYLTNPLVGTGYLSGSNAR